MADQEDRSFEPKSDTDLLAQVDPAKLGQPDTPEAEWGEPLDGEAQSGANHLAREDRPEPDRGQGSKTRQANKDQFSRRA
jgi:hypothetical protein